MKRIIFFLLAGIVSQALTAQNVGIGTTTPNNSARLDVVSVNKGFLLPRVALTGTTDAVTIPSAATSLMVYNTATVSDVTPGFYYWSGTVWLKIASGIINNNSWQLTGNAGTNSAVNFIGTTDAQPLVFKVNNERAGYIYSGNTSLGSLAFNANTSGFSNSAFGYKSLENNTTGYQNTSLGYFTLNDNIGGTSNVAVGNSALGNNTSGDENCAIGLAALGKNTTRSGLVAVGIQALYNNGLNANFSYHATGNTAVGSRALFQNTSGYKNTATGFESLNNNINGWGNTATGNLALTNNSTGTTNNAYGSNSLEANTSGSYNNAFGFQSLLANTTGFYNVAVGDRSMELNTTGTHNVALGGASLNNNTTGTKNIAIGYGSDVSTNALTNATAIGYNALVSASNTMRFGNSFVTKWGFGGNVTNGVLQVGDDPTNGNGAYLSTSGIWTNASDVNKKENFKEVDGKMLLNKIMELPVTRWNYIGTSRSTTHIGPMAQDFKRLFNVGDDDKSISSIDPSGIALRAIQELIVQNEKLQKEMEVLKNKIAVIEQSGKH